MFRRTSSTQQSFTPLGSTRAKNGGGGGRSTSGSNFGWRTSSAGKAATDSANKRNLLPNCARPIGAHLSSRSAFSFKDPRPLTESTFKNKMIHRLMEFLSENNFAIGEKALRSPTIKDVAAIFEFIYRLFDPQFKVKSLVEDMPNHFKLLGYPFPLSSSSMKTISAPMSFPHALGAFVWLSELFSCALNFKPELILFLPDDGEVVNPTEPEETISKTIFSYNIQCYALHRQGETNFAPQNQYFDEFLLRLEAGEGGLDQMHAENERLLEEIQLLESSAPEQEQLTADCQKLELDYQKMDDYVAKLEEYNNMKISSNNELKQEFIILKQEIDEVRREIARKESIIALQEISPAEVKRMYMAKNELQNKLKSLSVDGERLEKEQYKIEIELCKRKECIDSKMADFRQRAKVFAERAKFDFDPNWLEVSPYDPKFSNHYQHTLRPGMEMITQLCNKAVHEMHSEVSKIQETACCIEEEIAQATEEISNYEKQIQEVDVKVQHLKQGKNGEVQRAAHEIDRLKLQFEELCDSKKMSLAEKEKQLEILTKQKKEKAKRHNFEVDEWVKFLQKETDAIAGHKEFLSNLNEEANQRLEEIRSAVES